MNDELVKRLREEMECPDNFPEDSSLMREAADAIEEMSRENESLAKSVNEASEILRKRWIPVTEALPESMHEYVLCCGAKGGQFVGWVATKTYDGGDKARAFAHGGQGRNITHWMPLPEPPKEG